MRERERERAGDRERETRWECLRTREEVTTYIIRGYGEGVVEKSGQLGSMSWRVRNKIDGALQPHSISIISRFKFTF